MDLREADSSINGPLYESLQHFFLRSGDSLLKLWSSFRAAWFRTRVLFVFLVQMGLRRMRPLGSSPGQVQLWFLHFFLSALVPSRTTGRVEEGRPTLTSFSRLPCGWLCFFFFLPRLLSLSRLAGPGLAWPPPPVFSTEEPTF